MLRGIISEGLSWDSNRAATAACRQIEEEA
jgi:hypothetical protein